MDTIETEEPRLGMLRALPLMHRLLRLIFVGERERFTKTQFYILITLFHQSPLTMTQIGEHIGASKEQATRAVAPEPDEGLRVAHGGRTCARAGAGRALQPEAGRADARTAHG